MRLATTVVGALSLRQALVQANERIPVCLAGCLADVTAPCSSASLPALTSCLNAECSANSALARYTTTLSPKKEYSCQQSFIPGSDASSALLKVTGLGRCATSPYNFQSFIPGPANGTFMSDLCTLELYPDPECVGEPLDVDLADIQTEECVFKGGRSARLNCTPKLDTSAALRYIRQVCSNASDPALSTSLNGSPSGTVTANTGDDLPTTVTSETAVVTTVISASPTGTGYGSFNGTSPPTGYPTPTSATSPPPFYGGTPEGKIQDTSVMALVVFVAAFALF